MSRDGIAAAIFESRKIALKTHIWHNISTGAVVVLVRASWSRRGLELQDFGAWAHFSSCKSGFPYFKKVVYSGTRPLFHCRTDPQCHRCLEWFQLHHWSEVPCELIWLKMTNISHSRAACLDRVHLLMNYVPFLFNFCVCSVFRVSPV